MALDKRFVVALALNALGCFLVYEFVSLSPGIPENREPAPSAKNAGRRLSATKIEIVDGAFTQGGKKIGRHPGKIFGVGGNDYTALAQELGFEAFRTWGRDQLPWAMIEAARASFFVMAGLDMTRDPRYYAEGSEHCSDDLEESDYWKSALRSILREVNTYKSDPHILMWLVGNEMEIPIDTKAGNDCLWKRVNWVAGKVKEEDPDHPVGVALAGIASPKVKKMVELCPNIEVLGTNIYGNEIRDVGERLRKDGWTKPWAFTECGALGPWEVPQTSWGAPMEQSSTEKGRFIMKGLRMCDDDEMCVSFMAFLWGWKWEKTGTWFGLINDWTEAKGFSFLNDIGQPIYDEFGPEEQKAFRIHIEGFKVDGDKSVDHLGFAATKGAEVQLDVLPVATPFDGDNGAWAWWVVTRESLVHAKSDANIPEETQPVIPGVVAACPGSFRAKLQTSMLDEGRYRLYVFVRRKHEGGFEHYPETVEASLAVPFYVGEQRCEDVTSGYCFDEVTRVMTSTKRMGYAMWPAEGTFPHSDFKEVQASLHMVNHAGCPAACSVQIPADATTDCSEAPEVRYEADVPTIQKLFEPPENPYVAGECHTAVPHEECWYSTKWLMEEGRFTTPDFPELDESSTWEEGQLALYHRARNNCKKPCTGDEGRSEPKKSEDCHTSVEPEDCYWATKWLMDEGRWTNPEWFPEVTAESTWEDAQEALWTRSKNNCQKPCRKEEPTTTKEPETTTKEPETTTKPETTEEPEPETTKEDCYTSVEPEDCFWGTKWLMDEGRWKHPEWFPEVTAESTWEDAQEALWKRGQNGCHKPCAPESEETPETEEEEDCHNSVPPEDCYYATKWLMDEGRWKHAHAFPEVTADSTWADAQHALWKRSEGSCKKPCAPEEPETTKEPTTEEPETTKEPEPEEPETTPEPEEETVPKEEPCYTSQQPEDCFWGTKWLMDEGRWKYPDAFPEVTAESTWEDAQEALWKRGKNGCQKPCRPESEESGEPEPEEPEELKEECYTSVPHEDCYHATKWLMEEGRWKHPDAFPEVTAESSWEDAQRALHNRGENGCKLPCPHDSDAETEELDEEKCHNSVPHEDCYYATKWLLDEGRYKYPDAFPEVKAHSTWADAQRALWKRSKDGCQKPCRTA